METLTKLLNEIPNSYYEFIDSTLKYASKSPKHLELLQDYLSDHEEATVSDILRLISTQSDFYDDYYIEKAEAVAI